MIANGLNRHLTLEDIIICARTVFGEARGESFESKVDVAHVMLNRWKRTDGQFARDDTLATACLRHVQFSGWTPSDPNFVPQIAASVQDPVFRDCLRATLDAIGGEDTTSGATHYHTINPPNDHTPWPPLWARGHKPCLIRGRHQFYNSIR